MSKASRFTPATCQSQVPGTCWKEAGPPPSLMATTLNPVSLWTTRRSNLHRKGNRWWDLKNSKSSQFKRSNQVSRSTCLCWIMETTRIRHRERSKQGSHFQTWREKTRTTLKEKGSHLREPQDFRGHQIKTRFLSRHPSTTSLFKRL